MNTVPMSTDEIVRKKAWHLLPNQDRLTVEKLEWLLTVVPDEHIGQLRKMYQRNKRLLMENSQNNAIFQLMKWRKPSEKKNACLKNKIIRATPPVIYNKDCEKPMSAPKRFFINKNCRRTGAGYKNMLPSNRLDVDKVPANGDLLRHIASKCNIPYTTKASATLDILFSIKTLMNCHIPL
jgi:hypothetical protein